MTCYIPAAAAKASPAKGRASRAKGKAVKPASPVKTVVDVPPVQQTGKTKAFIGLFQSYLNRYNLTIKDSELRKCHNLFVLLIT